MHHKDKIPLNSYRKLFPEKQMLCCLHTLKVEQTCFHVPASYWSQMFGLVVAFFFFFFSNNLGTIGKLQFRKLEIKLFPSNGV